MAAWKSALMGHGGRSAAAARFAGRRLALPGGAARDGAAAADSERLAVVLAAAGTTQIFRFCMLLAVMRERTGLGGTVVQWMVANTAASGTRLPDGLDLSGLGDQSLPRVVQAGLGGDGRAAAV